ncbi:replication protein A 70 kDa DNA-binding subunit B [Tanacetum coccineum]
MELIVMDEHNTKMRATVGMGLINRFKHRLEEGNAVTLQRYSLGEIQPKFRMVNKALRLSFLSNTKVETCPDFSGSYHGFAWRPHKSIIDLQKEEDGQLVSFAMTINKSQGQSLSKVGLYLARHVFTHGQLYVALSIVKSKRGLKVVVCDDDGNVSKTTTNIVYKEVFHGL